MNISKLTEEQVNHLNETVSLALEIMNAKGFDKKVAAKIAAKKSKYKPLGHVYIAVNKAVEGLINHV